MTRFWAEARVVPAEGGHAIALDSKPVRIPGAAVLVVRSPALAGAIAAEWQRAGGERGGRLRWDELPLTRLAGTAQARIAPDPLPTARELARFAESDLLCYRAERPDSLVARQARAWQPWLDWLARTHGAVLQVREGIMHRPQDPAALAHIGALMEGHSAETLAGLGIAIPLLGSAVLGLAMAEGALAAAEAHRLAALDELFNEEAWGADPEAVARRDASAADLAVAERFIRLAAS